MDEWESEPAGLALKEICVGSRKTLEFRTFSIACHLPASARSHHIAHVLHRM
jgi:hypothetical protein